jgi:uncharacterized protein
MEQPLSDQDKSFLLSLARQTIQKAVNHQPLPVLEEEGLSDDLTRNGAAFVTLTMNGELRGCIGSLEAYQSLVADVRDHARQAALEDYRFPPVTAGEVTKLHIEISRLTAPVPLKYDQPSDLPTKIKPNEDGVILKDGFRRATFLPQVWQQLADPVEFLSHLCVKMGASADLWQKKLLEVSIYHVEEFQEA